MKLESAHVKHTPGGLLTENYNLLCNIKTIDYKMMVIILKQKLTHSFSAHYYSISRNS